MNKTTIAYTGVLVVAMLLTWISVAYAETYDVEISDTGFNPTNSTINYTDSIRFVSTSNFTWIIDLPTGGTNHIDNIDGRTYTMDCGTYTYTQHVNYDDNLGLTPFTLIVENCPQPEVVEVVPTNSTSTTPEVEEESTIIPTTTLDSSATDNVIVDGEEPEYVKEYKAAENETLGLRLQILTVLESILSIIFGK